MNGIFFDDVMNTCGPTTGSDEYAKDYRFLSSTVHTAHPGSLTVLNPGVTVPQCYEDAGDVLLTFEGPASDYLTRRPISHRCRGRRRPTPTSSGTSSTGWMPRSSPPS